MKRRDLQRKNLQRPTPKQRTLLQAAVMIALIGLYLAALAIINRNAVRPKQAQMQTDRTGSAIDDLPDELRRCNALRPQTLGHQTSGPQDSGDAHCRAIWAENRRRFFGLPPKFSARIPASQPAPSSIAPQMSNTGGAR